jgi:hypothetical protein
LSVAGIDEDILYCIETYKKINKEKKIEIRIIIEKDNIIYNTSEGHEILQEKIFTPFKTALIKTKHLRINNSIKNVNL